MYLDYNSTTPTDPLVVKSMIPVFEKQFGNPSSASHATGRNAKDLVDEARRSVADLVGMGPADVIFTSGATEANNMVLHGLSLNKQKPPCILVGATEHKSVLEPCNALSKQGAIIKTIPVGYNGTIDIRKLDKMLADNNVDLISVMVANSETGVINPIQLVVKHAHEFDVLVHCDATQAIGKIPFNMQEFEIDMVTFSSHKIYGPKGCGALVATRDARKQLQGIFQGGGQENNMRSGTLNVPGIVGFGVACEIVMNQLLSDIKFQKHLRNYFEEKIHELIPHIKVNGKESDRLPNTSNIRLIGALADAIIANAPEIEISTGSACTSFAMEPSHVLTAMGLNTDQANECIRISIGRNTTQQDMDIALDAIVRAAEFVREKESKVIEGMTKC